MPNPTVLVVEDDLKTSQLIEQYLLRDGYTAICAVDGEAGLKAVRDQKPDLIILDVMLPKRDGLSICSEIRRTTQVPILFLTARDDELDRIVGLELGGDDYMVKPFSPRELMARVKALFRRSQWRTEMLGSSVVRVAGLEFDGSKRRVSLNQQPVSLTPIEFALLQTLITSPGRVFLRAELLDRIYPDGEVVIDRVVDVHIGKLRQKIGDDPNSPHFIFTVRGVGYRFVDAEE